MQAKVHLRTPDGIVHVISPGGIIGRLPGAALLLRDPRVSEAHAMVSLRGGALHLLTLRGRFACEGRAPSSLALAAGQHIEFARDLGVDVVQVDLPRRVLVLCLEGGEEVHLSGVISLVRQARPALVHGYQPDAVAVFWCEGGAWRQRGRGGAASPLDVGALQIEGCALECRWLDLVQVQNAPTRQLGGVAAPLLMICHFDTVQLHQDGQLQVTVSGNGARIISELVSYGAPVEWRTLAREIWGDQSERKLRRNLDQTLLRMRKKLEASRIRPELVRADGSGKLELVLGEGDRVEDRG